MTIVYHSDTSGGTEIAAKKGGCRCPMTPRDNFGQIWKLKKGDACKTCKSTLQAVCSGDISSVALCDFCMVMYVTLRMFVCNRIDKRCVDGVNIRVVIEMR